MRPARKQALSNAALGIGLSKRIARSPVSWILVATIALQLLESRETLFGFGVHDSLGAMLSLSPAQPIHFYGIPLLTYPLIHAGWQHWASSAFPWLLLAIPLRRRLPGLGARRKLAFLLAYGAASACIGLSYLLPFAPASTLQDRVLGLSALAFFQLGMILFLRPPLFAWLLLLAMALAWLFGGAGSALSEWAHGAGFLLGLTSGLLLRSFFPRAT